MQHLRTRSCGASWRQRKLPQGRRGRARVLLASAPAFPRCPCLCFGKLQGTLGCSELGAKLFGGVFFFWWWCRVAALHPCPVLCGLCITSPLVPRVAVGLPAPQRLSGSESSSSHPSPLIFGTGGCGEVPARGPRIPSPGTASPSPFSSRSLPRGSWLTRLHGGVMRALARRS